MKNVKNIQRNCTARWSNFARLIPLIVLLFSTTQMAAQVPKELPAVNTGKVNAGSLLTQFAGAIKPSSFTDLWASEKTNWLSSAAKIATAPGMIEGITSLTKFIKPTMFKEAFKPANLLQTATKTKSMADAAGLLKTLSGGLKPEAMVSSWSGKESSWLSALNLLK